MQNTFSSALSEAISHHIPLSATRRETLAWLTLLIMRQGTICLWRLAAHVATTARTDSVRRRFYPAFLTRVSDETVGAVTSAVEGGRASCAGSIAVMWASVSGAGFAGVISGDGGLRYLGRVRRRGMSRPMLNFGAVHCLVSDYATFAG